MINTSSHNGWQSDKYRTYAISGNRGKDASYEGECYPKLAPKYSFWKVWHDNIGTIDDEENNKYYIEEYWKQVLSKLDPEEEYRILNNSVLLCYEPNTDFCHRHIVSAWFELLLGMEIHEAIAKDYIVKEVEKPGYIKEYLEEIIKQNIDMRGLNSLRALFLLEKAEKTDIKADALELFEERNCSKLRRAASYLRHSSQITENNYNEGIKKKLTNKISQ